MNTPDGREGWASYFLKHGYIVYLTDQAQRGRSPWLPGDSTVEAFPVEYEQKYFIKVEDFKLWPQAALHTQWPGTGLVGDPIFDTFYKSQVQLQINRTYSEALNRAAGVALLDRIGSAILITHSQAGSYGWGIGDDRPDLVKGIVALEPEGPPFTNKITGSGPARPYGVATQPLTYDPPVINPATDLQTETTPLAGPNLSSCTQQTDPAKKLVNLSKIPVLVVTSEASYHAVYDYCTVNYLKQAGVDVTFLDLPKVGIHGNGHFMFLEKNSLEIVPLIQAWIEGTAERGR